MPAVNKATPGTPEDDFGVPNFDTCPSHAVLKVARDLAAAAAQTSVPLDRQQIAAQQSQCNTEVKAHPAIADSVASLVAAYNEGPASKTCVFAAFLAVFVAADAASQNLGFGAVNVVNVLLNDVTAKVFEANQAGPVKYGHAVPDAGLIDLKFHRFLMIVFAPFANFASVLTEHHGVIGMSGRNALSIYMLHLYAQQPLHTRVDIVYARAGLTAIPLAAVKWGGMAVATAVKHLKDDWQINQFLASYAADACQGMLSTSMSDCAIGMLQQPRTPINLVAVKIMMLTLFEAIAEENRTFTALQNVITRILQQPCFEMSTMHDDLNPDGLALNAVDGASGGKTCRCCRKATCDGRFGVLQLCPASHRHGTPLPSNVSGVPHALVAAYVVTVPARPTTPGGRAGGAPGAKGVCYGFQNTGSCRFGDSCRYSHTAKAVTPASAATKAAAVSAIDTDIDASSYAEFQAFKRFKTQHTQQVETEMPRDAASKFMFVRFSPYVSVFKKRRWAFIRRTRTIMQHRASYAPALANIVTRAPSHHQSYQSCLVQIRTAAKLPCGRHGNPLLMALLVHRMQTARLSNQTTDVNVSATLVQSPLFGTNGRLRDSRSPRKPPSAPQNKKIQTVRSRKRPTAKSPREFLFPPPRTKHKLSGTCALVLSDANIMRYTLTPVPTGSAVREKILKQSEKESKHTNRMLRLPRLSRRCFDEIHKLLRVAQDSLPVIGHDRRAAQVPEATQSPGRRADYASGSQDDTAVSYSDSWRDTRWTDTRKIHLKEKNLADSASPDDKLWVDTWEQERILAGCYRVLECRSAHDPSVNGVDSEPVPKRHRVAETHRWYGHPGQTPVQCDSGTNVDTCNDLTRFVSYKSFPTPRTVSVANGQSVLAYGEGKICIALEGEALQRYSFQQRFSDPRTPTSEKLYIVLPKVSYIPTFKKNFIDMTALRKADGIHIVGDQLSNRIVDARRGLQYSVVESGGQEYIRGSTLSTEEFGALSVLQVNNVDQAESTPDRKTRKRISRSVKRLKVPELKEIVNAPAVDARYSEFTREAARIELCRSGVYTYNHGQSDLLLQYHHRFSHASLATTVRTLKSMGLMDRLDKGARLFCLHCLLARPRRMASRKVGTSDHKNRIFSKFFVDCAGPFTPAAGTKNKYSMTVIDRCSGHNYTYYCQSTGEVPLLFKRFLIDVKLDLAAAGVQAIHVALGKMIFQSDNASVFAGANSRYANLLAEMNLKRVHGLAYTPQHQAKVERFFGTIKARAKSMLKASGLDDSFWEMAWRYCCSVYNYLDNASTLHHYSPYQMVTGKDPGEFLRSLRSFGTTCVVTVPGTTPTTYEATYLGHSVSTESPDRISGHWVLDKSRSTHVIKRAHHVRFADTVPRLMADQTIVNLRSKYEDDDEQLDQLWSAIDLDELLDEVTPSTQDAPNPTDQSQNLGPETGILPHQIMHPAVTEAPTNAGEPEADTGELDSVVEPEDLPTTPMSHEPGEWINIDLWHAEQHANFISTPSVNALIATEYPTMGADIAVAHVTDTIHYTRAAAISDNPGYAASDAKELKAMEDHEVWETVPITSLTDEERKNLCRAHMLRYPKFSGELNGERQVEKLKSRLVFDGRSQSVSQCGEWTASNTPRQSTCMMHFGMAPLCKNEVFMSTDISTAFLRAPQQTADGSRCIMRMPRDIATFTTDGGKLTENVHVLKRSLYGQRQSSLAYEKLFVTWACDDPNGPQFQRSTVDPCVFYSASGRLRMIVYVDDCNWRGCPVESANLVKMFELRWGAECKLCKYFLNMRLARDDRGYINVSQPHYADHMAKVFDLEHGKVARTPLPPGTSVTKLERVNFKSSADYRLTSDKVSPVQQNRKKHRVPQHAEGEAQQRTYMDTAAPDQSPTQSTESDALIGKNLTRFKEAWGQLSYYATATRPDLCYAVSLLGQVSAGPRMRHWRLAQQTIRYAYHTKTYGVKFRKLGPAKVNEIECYVDSSFGEGPLARSQTGYVFMLNGGPISWASRLQSHTATSTMEAETSAACDAAKENAFLRDLCHEMGAAQKAVRMLAHGEKVHPQLWDKPPIRYHEDNAACLAYNHQINVSRRNRHMGRPYNLADEPADILNADRCHRVNFHSLRDHIADDEATMVKCNTDDMLADLLTKALNTNKTERFRNGMLSHIPIIHDGAAPDVVPFAPVIFPSVNGITQTEQRRKMQSSETDRRDGSNTSLFFW